MNAVIIQHQDDAPAGLLLDALSAAGVDWLTVHLDRGELLPTPESLELAVSLGSDASADDASRDWITRELEWLRGADRAGAAILGLCFGAQALALALGGGVARAPLPERGFVRISSDDSDIVGSGPWFTWHDDVIELPLGAELLGHNDSGPQAFRAGRHLGLQFHPEATPEIVAGWVRASRSGELNDQAIPDGTATEWPEATAGASRLFARFLSSVGSPARP